MDLKTKEKYRNFDLIIKNKKQFEEIPIEFNGKIIIDCDNNIEIIEIDNFIKAEITICGNTKCNIKNSIIKSIYEDVKIDDIYNSLIGEITENVNILRIYGFSIIDYIQGDVEIDQIYEDVFIKSICGNTNIDIIYDNVIIKQIFNNAVIENILDCSIIIVLDSSVKINNLFGNCKIIYSFNSGKEINEIDSNKLKMIKNLSKQNYQIQRFLLINNIEPINNKIILYKIVFENLPDSTVMVFRDWNPNPKLFGGSGYILYPSSETARYYNNNKGNIIKCEVDLSDIIISFEDITRVRCRKIKVLNIDSKI